MTTAEVKLDEKIKQSISEPKRWKVIFLNDDQTPIEFVIGVLIEIFKHTQDTAKQITLEIHNEGSGIAGVYSCEIAEVKTVETTNLARQNGFPLQIKMEEE
ncbi:ATP-dependent Clp protease adaptor ClpS [bacterium]|nr:ATP-dependent Clp protease adaptor ClpS [bacterium]